MSNKSLTDRLRADPTSDIMVEAADRIDALREALTDLTSANDHVEYGRALARSRAALVQEQSYERA